MLCGNSDENGNAIRDYDTAKRIRRRVTLQQKQFKDYKNMENKKEEPTLNKVTFVNGVQIKNKSGKH